LQFSIRTRAATRALSVAIGVALGLTFGAVCVANGAGSPAKAYGAAALAGYVKASVAPAPAKVLAPVAVTPPALRPLAAPPRTLDCLAAAVYYEARGESAAGRAAVAQVVLNRTRRGGFPSDVCAVVYQGAKRGECQFSFVCNGAMHARREHMAWLDARHVAARALGGYVMAEIGKATFFHAAGASTPSGAVRLGGHVFFT